MHNTVLDCSSVKVTQYQMFNYKAFGLEYHEQFVPTQNTHMNES